MGHLQRLPSVDAVLRELRDLDDCPPSLLLRLTRETIQSRRAQILNGEIELSALPVTDVVRQRVNDLKLPSLRRVINATGIVLHTNLGRAPLRAFAPVAGWSNLELDLATGKRGKRDAHTAVLLEALLGRAAILVNNNAAAVFLILHELASGGEVLISRGELIEIGDGFRIPDIMQRSGAVVCEVGTTNRTRIEDYRAAMTEQTRLILRVHPSNFQISGFTDRPLLADLTQLGTAAGVPVYEDLGSGCLVNLQRVGMNEPLVSDSFAAGVNILSFSCDKLLGGPQAGIIAGDAELVARVRGNPMYRAFRVDKLTIECLQQTLRSLLFERWDEIPALAGIFTDFEDLRVRANRLRSLLGSVPASTVEDESPIGGGSTPNQTLPTVVVKLPVEHPMRTMAALRRAKTPVIARIAGNQIVFDMRTVAEEELVLLADAIRSILEVTMANESGLLGTIEDAGWRAEVYDSGLPGEFKLRFVHGESDVAEETTLSGVSTYRQRENEIRARLHAYATGAPLPDFDFSSPGEY